MSKKDLLKRLVIAVTGDFGTQRSMDKMKAWIHAHGGSFSPDVSTKVTHLICSKEDYRNQVLLGKRQGGSYVYAAY